MSYLKEIETQLHKKDFTKLLELWDEYCKNDTADVDEFAQIFEVLKKSDLAPRFGKVVEMALPLWQTISDEKDSYKILKLIVDLQTTNSTAYAELVLNALTKRYSESPEFNEYLRLVGMKTKENFQGALSNYEILVHLKPGKCVYHAGGWGTGEVVDASSIREQATIEFEHLSGKKTVTFTHAFKSLIPLADDDFRTRRFLDADTLEKEAKDNPVEIIKILLRDLGPKTASEIKDELCDLVIPEAEWTRWWQAARSKLKKDTFIETPDSLREPFRLLNTSLSHEDRFQKELLSLKTPAKIIQASYNFIRDFPQTLKNTALVDQLCTKMEGLLTDETITLSQELEIYMFLELLPNAPKREKSVATIITALKNIIDVINNIEILAFKKRALTAIKENRQEWPQLFLTLLSPIQQSQLRDYIIKELQDNTHTPLLKDYLEQLVLHPEKDPETFVWYFQKLIGDSGESLPFQDNEGQGRFFEAFLVLLHKIESIPPLRDLAKKMVVMMTSSRYALIRTMLEGKSLEFVKEFLLLASKCQSFTQQDIKILHSLTQVVHPSLTPEKKAKERLELDGRYIWTTEEGLHKTQEKVRHIGTVEVVENSREVEAARALGDLRENSEYKFACERRRHLQGELRRLTEDLSRARVITEHDIDLNEIGIGNTVEVTDAKGEKQSYTILGPWDAIAENNILSFQSKLAQAMLGRKLNDKFSFKDEDFVITKIGSYLKG